MRIARVHTNLTCNHSCAFCNARRVRELPSFVHPIAVRRRINAAARGSDEIILTGGEPTMRRDLAQLVARARARGFSKVVLETNAALVTEARAAALADAGLDLARVHVPAWADRHEQITLEPGSFSAMLSGAQALAQAGITLEAATPLVRANVDVVAALPRQLLIARDVFPARAWIVSVPQSGPQPEAYLPATEAARALEEAEAAARREGLTIRLEQDTQLPPCLFERPARVAHLFSLTRGGAARDDYRQQPACRDCVARAQCPGFPVAALTREPGLRARPIAQDRVRRRLNVISTVEEQIARELRQDDIQRLPSGELIPARIVRINFRCNQACHFCFVSTHLPAAEDDAIEDAIRGIARARGVLVLSGGEPTLNPRVLDFVRLGKREGARAIELQTNAIRMAEPGLARALAEAGVSDAFISLHGSRAEISDAVTNAPGTFARTVDGIDQAVTAALRVRLNFVFCQANYADFPAYVDMVARRWPSVTLVVSFVATSTDVVPRSRDLQPRYSDIMGPLAEGLGRAAAAGLTVLGFESMCGIPMCLVPADLSPYFELAEIPEDFDGGEFIKAEACRECALAERCFGVRRGYAELYGTSEFQPVPAPRPS